MSEQKIVNQHFDALATSDTREAPTTFDLKFIECAHIIKIPLRVHPDPHAPRAPKTPQAQRSANEFLSRPVPVPGVCPTCYNTKPAAGPHASAAAATAAAPATPYKGIHPAALWRQPKAPALNQPDPQPELESAVPPP
ncbi:MAG TPA: hypothetical protein VGD60_05070 [Candidatus Acidoferrales bacterium]